MVEFVLFCLICIAYSRGKLGCLSSLFFTLFLMASCGYRS